MTQAKRVAAGFFGVEPEVIRERGGPIAVVGDMWQMTKQTVVALAYFPAKVYYTAYNLVTGQPRDIYGPMSIVGASRAAGEIASTDQIDAAAQGREPVHCARRGQPVRGALQLRPAAAIGRRARGCGLLRGGETGLRSPPRTTRSRSCGHGEAAARGVRRRRSAS